MFARPLFVVLLLLLAPVTAGCAAMRGPRMVEAAGESADDGWLAMARRRIAQASRDIEADLNFHEGEGLESFAPDAVEQVNALRGEMQAAAGISR